MDDLRLTSLNLPGIDENKRPLVIAGPCSAETEEQVMATAGNWPKKDSRYSVPVYGSRVPNREGSKVWARRHYPGCNASRKRPAC